MNTPVSDKSHHGSGLSLFPRPIELDEKPVERRPYQPQRDSKWVDAIKRCEEYRALRSLVND